MSFNDIVDDILDKGVDLKEELERMAKDTISKITTNADIENFNTEEMLENFKETLSDIMKSLQDKVNEYQAVITEMGGIGALLKTVWNLEEETIDTVTFEFLVTWSKQYFKKDKHSAVCFLAPQQKSSFVLPFGKTASSHEYNLFFIDKNNKPLFDGSEPHKIFYAKTIDSDLKAQLADKNMLLLN